MIAALSLILAASAAPASKSHVATLRCGPAEMRLTSETYVDRGAPLAPRRQTLIRAAGARRIPVGLEHGRTVVVAGYRVSDRYVASWACATGKRESYVVLGYSCSVDPGAPGDCGGDKEWFRLLDRRGRFADAGVPRDGVGRDALYARLGIANAFRSGLKMTPVVE